MTLQNTVSVIQTLELIKQLIAENRGDILRLRYIYEFLEQGRYLYSSDQNYLEKKVDAKIVYEEKKSPSKQKETSRKIRDLIELRIGNLERLRFMLTWISKKQSLLNSDQKYLDKKMQLIHKKIINKKRIRSIQSTYSSKIIDLEEDFKQTTPYSIKHVRQLKSELVLAKKTINHLQLDIATLKGTIQHLNLQNKKSKQ